MPSWAGRVRALPPGRRRATVVAVAVGYAVVVYGLALAAHAALGDGPVDWVEPAVPAVSALLGLLVVAGLPSWLAGHRRRVALREEQRPLVTAARTGRLPADVDPAVWRPFLVQRRQVLRRRTALTLTAVGAATVGSLALVVLLADAPVAAVALGLLVSVQALLGVLTAGRRAQRRLTAMLGRLPAGAPGDRVAG